MECGEEVQGEVSSEKGKRWIKKVVRGRGKDDEGAGDYLVKAREGEWEPVGADRLR